jgi:hypothetical protein
MNNNAKWTNEFREGTCVKCGWKITLNPVSFTVGKQTLIGEYRKRYRPTVPCDDCKFDLKIIGVDYL